MVEREKEREDQGKATEHRHRSIPGPGQLRPLVMKSTNPMPNLTAFPMSPDQLQQHRTQLHEHMQLLVDVGLHARMAAVEEADEKAQKLEKIAKVRTCDTFLGLVSLNLNLSQGDLSDDH